MGFMVEHYKNDQTKSLKEYLKDHIIAQVKDQEPIFNNSEQGDVDIACIHFAYNNSKVMSLLTKRGNILTKGKYDKLEEIEELIKEEFQKQQ